MQDTKEVIARFLGFDPLAGETALKDLVAIGDAGEDALFSTIRPYPTHRQHRRRWLRYVASRQPSILNRLLAILSGSEAEFSRYHAAFLLAGMTDTRQATSGVYDILRTGIDRDGSPTATFLSDYYFYSSVFVAWGHAGGSSATLYNLSSRDEYVWEKLKTFAFRAACSSFSRINSESVWALERLVTLTWNDDDAEASQISVDPDVSIPHRALDNGELWLQAHQVFPMWRRGGVADSILGDWSQHPHWRVRAFGARILAAMGFSRIVAPVLAWVRREAVPAVRASLFSALECSATKEGASALLELYEANPGEVGEAAARALWLAADQERASRALLTMSTSSNFWTSAESITSLARLGTRHPKLSDLLDSREPYVRLHAALAYAYLGDGSVCSRLRQMQREVADPLENIILTAARAMLGELRTGLELHQAVVSGAAEDYPRSFDLSAAKLHLKEAVIAGFATGGEESQHYLEAWQAELAPLELVAQPIVLAGPTSSSSSPYKELATSKGPLRIFLSYSHRDERMRERLGHHLAPMESAGLIRVWHDRAIEAGADWEGEINREIADADVVMLLVSASFLNSAYCQKELKNALQNRGVGKALAVPIILRHCDWESTFNLPGYKTQALPRDNRPIAGSNWPNQDVALTVVARELRKLFERILSL